MYCIDELDSSFINACHLQTPSNFFTLLANFVVQLVNPRTTAIVALAVILGLPLLFLVSIKSSSISDFTKKYHHAQLNLLNFLHRVGYSLTLDIGLYACFRQLRPCSCSSTTGVFQHVGSIYGMPSGDAMGAAILGAWIMDAAPFFPWLTRTMGFLLTVVVCAERVLLGYHTVAQTTVGACIGFLLHLYSTRAPQYFIFVDILIQVIFVPLVLRFDPHLSFSANDMNNLYSWYVWGVSFLVFVGAMVYRHYARSGSLYLMRHSLQHINEDMAMDEDSDSILDIKSHNRLAGLTRSTDVVSLSGVVYTIAALVVFLFVNMLSFGVTQYGWGVPADQWK